MKNGLLILIIALFPTIGMGAINVPGTPVTPPDSLQADCDTLWLKSGKILLCEIISDNGVEVKFTDCPPSEIVSTIAKSATKLSPRDSIRKANNPLECDKIYLRGGEIIEEQVKYETKRKLVYLGCCDECVVEKSVMMNTVDSIFYVNGTPGVNNGTALPQPKIEKPPVVYTGGEQDVFRKKQKTYAILATVFGSLAAVGVILLVAATGATIGFSTLFGVGFFVFTIVALVFLAGHIRNKRKLDGGKKKKDKKKKEKKDKEEK